MPASSANVDMYPTDVDAALAAACGHTWAARVNDQQSPDGQEDIQGPEEVLQSPGTHSLPRRRSISCAASCVGGSETIQRTMLFELRRFA